MIFRFFSSDRIRSKYGTVQMGQQGLSQRLQDAADGIRPCRVVSRAYALL